jgi:hypothetical protein
MTLLIQSRNAILSCSVILICLIEFTGLSASFAQATAPVPAASADETTEQTIAEDIKSLASSDFAERQRATSHLVRAGQVCIMPLIDALPQMGNEAQLRAIHVLQSLALSSQMEDEQAALVSLLRLAQSEQHSISSKASDALNKVSKLREEISLRHLAQLGAVIEIGPTILDGQIVELPVSLTFAEKFTGHLTDLRHLRWLTTIQHIELVGKEFGDDSIDYLQPMQQLMIVEFKKCSITAAAPKMLKQFRRLPRVAFYHCSLGNDSLADLAEIPALRELKLYGTQVTQEAADQWPATYPHIELDYRRGALLGVACLVGSQGCLVNRVEPGSAAEKAGIQENDLILKFNGQPVADIEQLTAQVAKLEAGSKATIIWRRGDAELQAEVELGTW